MKITLSQLKTATLSALAERLIVASKEGKFTISVNENPLLKAIEEEYKIYKELVNKQAYSGKGKVVAEADEARDKAFVAIKTYLKGC